MNPINPAALAALLPAALLSLATSTGPYALAVDGNALAPRVKHGALVAITPAVNAKPCSVEPGSLVLAVTASDPAQPHRFDRPALFLLDEALALTSKPDGGGATIPQGAYIILGVAQEGVIVNAIN